MRYGISLPITGFDNDIQSVVELACLAEKSGWDGLLIEDYILYYAGDGSVFDPWLTLTAVALRTQRILLSISVTPLPRRRPWKVAREALTLDHLSNGRFILGLRAGGPDDGSFTHFGEVTDMYTRAEMLDEGLDIIVGLLGGEPFHYSGKHYQVQETVFLSSTAQKPRIPIWIGVLWPRKGPLRRAARTDGFLPIKVGPDGRYNLPTPEDVRAIKHDIEHLRPPQTTFDIVIGGEVDRSHTHAHIQAFEEAGATWWVEFLKGSFEEQHQRVLLGPPK